MHIKLSYVLYPANKTIWHSQLEWEKSRDVLFVLLDKNHKHYKDFQNKYIKFASSSLWN